jgi:hypothetical protein
MATLDAAVPRGLGTYARVRMAFSRASAAACAVVIGVYLSGADVTVPALIAAGAGLVHAVLAMPGTEWVPDGAARSGPPHRGARPHTARSG